MRTGSIIATLDTRGRRVADDGNVLHFTASSQAPASDGGVLYASGWSLDRFNGGEAGKGGKGGPFLWGHRYDLAPIGRALAYVEGDRLLADVTIDRADPLGAETLRKYKEHYLRDVSVGFSVIEEAPPAQVPEGARWASLRHELLDLSAVSVGADRFAVQRGVGAIAAAVDADTQRWAHGLARRVAPQADAKKIAALTGRILEILERARTGKRPPRPRTGKLDPVLLGILDRLDQIVISQDRSAAYDWLKADVRELLATVGR